MTGAAFSPGELAAATGGAWLNGTGCSVCGIGTDTRADGTGSLFVALCGERFDAHDFLEAAVRAGYAALCIRRDRREQLPPGIPALLVDDTLTALQGIAAFHRNRFPALPVAAVTGSVGKTSVKEMLRAIFIAAAGAEHVVCTEGNTNNQIGVPQNLLRIDTSTQFAVIEMGTNHPGEIAPLARIARPCAAVVNSIAPCHLEFLGSLAGVAREKGHVFDELPADGTAVIPLEAPEHELLFAAAGRHRVLTFGSSSVAAVRSHYLGGAMDHSSFELTLPGEKPQVIRWHLSGAHQAMNAAAAAAVAFSLGVPAATICAGLPSTVLPGMRMKITRLNGVTYINDAYNASPGSMRAALAYLAEFARPEQLVLLLGGMLELGDVSESSHSDLVAEAQRLFPGARIITVGREFAHVQGVPHFDQAGQVGLAQVVRDGDVVFAKASHGIGLQAALPPEAR